jgi:peptide deformylase
VTRPKRVTVEFLDRKGNSKTLDADEYFSHVVQHEVDHLDGILFLKYVLDPKELYTAKELDKMSE